MNEILFYIGKICVFQKKVVILHAKLCRIYKLRKILEQKKLTKSENKVLAGVCAGLAEYMGMDITVMRILYALLTFCSAAFPGVLLYLIMALVMPEPSDKY